MSLFNALNIGYSGLNASQANVKTISHNIANAETEGYTRQRVVTAAATPLDHSPGSYGNGVSITEVSRVFDAYTYDRYLSASEDKAYSKMMRSTMEELSTYFPDIEGVGVKTDLTNYFIMWQTLADNPDSSAIQVALAEETKTLTQNINYTRDRIDQLQNTMNDQVKTYIDEVNNIAADIAKLNGAIDMAESDGIVNANDLRDQRNMLEKSLSKLIGANVYENKIEANMAIHSQATERSSTYTIQVGGFNIVDGATYHPISSSNATNALGYYDLYYERQDGVKMPFESAIQGGKLGALMALRGSDLSVASGEPLNGVLQETINNLDAFAKGLIQGVNNVYARASTTGMESNQLNLDGATALRNYPELGVNEGSFDLIVYDAQGSEVSRREIVIDGTTSMDDITAQVAANNDDNGDNSATNDIDDFLLFTYDNLSGRARFGFNDARFEKEGYSFSLQDRTSGGINSGTNFAGATGLSRFFDGENAKTITLNAALKADPSRITPYQENVTGNNSVALSMIQLQFESMTFASNDRNVNDTLYGYYDTLVTDVGSFTNSMIHLDDTYTAQFNAIELEYQSISKVSLDEELTNLIKYQTAYGAASKVITTVDQMLNTLLGIKQ
ncbi:MAG: flagellar hook-associated protein FlgK [Sulfurimonas sp.]|nr:MAG: flagellar hook-associated protein FlgK [Sulfurimonas sp.]